MDSDARCVGSEVSRAVDALRTELRVKLLR